MPPQNRAVTHFHGDVWDYLRNKRFGCQHLFQQLARGDFRRKAISIRISLAGQLADLSFTTAYFSSLPIKAC